MIKSFAALSVTTGARLLTGLILFVLFAREWPAAAFGQFMYLFSVAALLVLACEFGFTQQILREIGRAPTDAARLMSRYLGAKVWLTLATWAVALIFAWITRLSWHDTAQLILLLAAASLMSYGDFFMACFRAMGHFGEEAWLAVAGNMLLFALALGALYFKSGPIGVALAMAAARLVQFLLSYRVFRRGVPDKLTPDFSLPATGATVRASSAYGADVAIGAAFINLDTVMIAHTLGQESVGVYQAIARIYQGAVLATAILGSIFLPRLARELGNRAAFAQQYQKLAWSLVVLGLLASAVFALGTPLLELVYTQPYLQRSLELMPWFALLVFVRFTASVYGVALTALGKQGSRALIYVAALVLMVASAGPLMSRFGEAGMVMACTLAYAFLAVLFAFKSSRSGAQPQAWKTATLVSLSLTAFSFWKAGLHP
jgi:O-antigen/teichoic acid export membrane protein